MRVVVQRVNKSSVKVDNEIVGSINKGFNVLVGIGMKDKVLNLRVFEYEEDKMNLSLKDVCGELLLISQFTLYGDCRKGRRPNFMNALGGDEAKKLFDEFVSMCREEGIKVETGVFGAHMVVDIENDGPVTLILDSKKNF